MGTSPDASEQFLAVHLADTYTHHFQWKIYQSYFFFLFHYSIHATYHLVFLYNMLRLGNRLRGSMHLEERYGQAKPFLMFFGSFYPPSFLAPLVQANPKSHH